MRKTRVGLVLLAIMAIAFEHAGSDAETLATVPAPGLVASARAYAKVIDEVNKMDLKDLQLPAPPPASVGNAVGNGAGRGR